MHRIFNFTVILIAILYCTACSTGPAFRMDREAVKEYMLETVPYPDTRFIVFSDPHYYSNTLGIEGEAFTEYLNNDRKLLVESKEILQEFIIKAESIPAEFVLICGDLTKDGELISHREFADLILPLKNQGKKVFVIPGNHDIRNPHAKKFEGDKAIDVESVTPEDFLEIYADYGYKDALFRDEHSLSYIAEAVPGLWVMGLDGCRYRENEDQPLVGGILQEGTYTWIESMLQKAASEKKAVIAFIHHGITEHYKTQKKYFPDFVLQYNEVVSKLLSSYGVRLVFTGHYHAQDITLVNPKTTSGKLFDIETGSFVTYPCPYRVVELSNGFKAMIRSGRITSIPSHKEDFSAYAYDFTFQGIQGLSLKVMLEMGVSEEDAEKVTAAAAKSMITHYAGDEKAPDPMLNLEGVSWYGSFIISFRRDLIEGFYTDLWPEDNDVVLDLN
ncbi:MAG: metallophosphoesterase [Spirochaetales bacterium]|nr:metallophosphoesterase [Spirochaetales bacterium]